MVNKTTTSQKTIMLIQICKGVLYPANSGAIYVIIVIKCFVINHNGFNFNLHFSSKPYFGN